MATKKIKVTSSSKTAIGLMRGMDVDFTIVDAKPDTKLYAFFNGIPVNHLISSNIMVWDWSTVNYSVLSRSSASIVTNAKGNYSGVFHIPADTFETGTKALTFQSTPDFFTGDFSTTDITHCSANFTSFGVLNTLQDTITESGEIVTNLIGGLGDPLAQSFFTYGTNGGIFVTSIDIFFDTKDDVLPVSLEIRELVNGYPGPNLVSTNAKVSLDPEQVTLQTSDTPINSTPFIFDYPVYLPDNGDFCFVLLSNSNKYTVYIAQLGERSKETGTVVSEQPYIGTLFKSENNKTWTADQTRDIKFRINRATFSSNSVLTMKANAPKYLILGTNISVTNASPVLTFSSDVRHGLSSDDIVTIKCLSDCNFRGISSDNLSGDRAVVSIVDDYTFKINAGTSATSTGNLNSSGIINDIQIDSPGTGYSVNDRIYVTPAITGGAPLEVAKVTEVTSGGITAIELLDITYSTYYTEPPVVLPITTASGQLSGTGAELFVISEAIIHIETNKNINVYMPKLAVFLPPNTDIKTTGHTINDDGTYNNSSSADVSLNEMNKLKNASLLLSETNENSKTPTSNSAEFELTLSTPIENLSPIISLNEAHNLEALSYNINDQTQYETINTLVKVGSGSIDSVSTTLTILNSGIDYTGTPTLVIDPPHYSWGAQATGVISLSGSNIDSATITNFGSGYLIPPNITVNGTGTGAVIGTPVLTKFNTELLPSGGTAASKYITKRMTLATVSTGVTVYVSAYSGNLSAFDVYIRTSVQASESPHSSRAFQMLECDIDRNKSTFEYEFKDYKFQLMGMDPFDVYDLKIVLRSKSKSMIPIIDNYRCVITAS